MGTGWLKETEISLARSLVATRMWHKLEFERCSRSFERCSQYRTESNSEEEEDEEEGQAGWGGEEEKEEEEEEGERGVV
jgi:hypothetical protein